MSHIQPNVTCGSTDDLFAAWIGLDGYNDSTVEQTGVATDCSSGRPVLSGWYEMYPAAPVYWNKPVSPGDSFNGKPIDDFNPIPLGGGGFQPTPLSGGTFSMTPGFGARGGDQHSVPGTVRN